MIKFFVNNLGETSRDDVQDDLGDDDVRTILGLGADAEVGDTHYDEAEQRELAKLSKQERAVFDAWRRLSGLTTNLFRVSARLREDWTGKEYAEVLVTTEFQALAGRPKFWESVYVFAREANARVDWEEQHRLLHGKNKGKWERQVGVVWAFPLTVPARTVDRFIKQMRFEIDQLPLRKQWVSVA